MARVPPGVDPTALTVAARRVLLDALDALGEHRPAVIVVGAQAVYLHSQDADFGVAAFTTDADLALDPSLLNDEPLINTAMQAAGFSLHHDAAGALQPGKWTRATLVDGLPREIPVDLIVPATLDTGRPSQRGARIAPHPTTAAMRTPGLELAVADHHSMTIAGLEPDIDPRRIEIHVAGVVALLVAKAHKIADRLTAADRGHSKRLSDKDAGDVFRLMTSGRTRADQATLQRMINDVTLGPTARDGARLLRDQFGTRAAPGVEMAVRALTGGTFTEDRIRDLCVAYTRAIVADLDIPSTTSGGPSTA